MKKYRGSRWSEPEPGDTRLGRWLSVPESIPADHRRFYILTQVGFLIPLAAHFLFLWTFLAIGETVLALFNVGSVAVWIGCIHFQRRGVSRLLGPPALSEIAFHAILSVVYLGIDAGFQYYLLINVGLVFLVPFYADRMKWLLAVGSVLLFAALMVYGREVAPLSVHPDWLIDVFLGANAAGIGLVIAAILFTYESTVNRAEAALRAAYARTDDILHILPGAIVERLKAGEETVADAHDPVTVLFADLVGFTRISSDSSPERVVEVLDGPLMDL